MPTSPVSVRIDETVKKDLLEVCQKTNRSQSQHIERAIADHVQREKTYISMIQEGRQSAAFVEHREVNAWLASWGTEEELNPPKPRRA